ncbi:Retrovirus-related Pol polyprotein from transposon RE1-like protein [Drosera capensis]
MNGYDKGKGTKQSSGKGGGKGSDGPPNSTGKNVQCHCKEWGHVKWDWPKVHGSLNRLKARLVAKGYSQSYGVYYEEIFSPVAKMFDVKNAFPNDILEEKVYMTQLSGFVVQEEVLKVCRLKRSLLSDNGSDTSQLLSQFGMTRSASDHSVFYRHLQEKTIILLAYVDDLIIIGDDIEGVFALKKYLSEQFQSIVLGKLKYFLGIERMENLCMILRDIRDLVGMLNYLTVTRPDIVYPVSGGKLKVTFIATSAIQPDTH